MLLAKSVHAQHWYKAERDWSWTGAGLTAVPKTIPKNALKVNLESNQIEVIRQNSFSHLGECKLLILRSNGIHDIQIGAWDGLDRLKTLALDFNEIEVIRQDWFTGLYRLLSLSLTGNKIHTIESGAWNGLVKLTKIYLHQNQLEVENLHFFWGGGIVSRITYTYHLILI